MRWIILLLAFVEGGWLAFDGAHGPPHERPDRVDLTQDAAPPTSTDEGGPGFRA